MENDWDEDEFRRTADAEFDVPHENDIFLKLVILAEMWFNMPKVAFGVKYPESVYKPSYSYYANFAPNWAETFLSRSQHFHGSTAATGKRGRPIDDPLPRVNWDPEDFDSERAYFGVRFDWVRELPGPCGTVIHLGFGRPASEAPVKPPNEIWTLVQCFVQAIMPRLVKKNQPHHDSLLTTEERLVLSMVLDGFDQELIGDLMRVSKSRIEKIAARAREALDRDDTLLAAAYALRLGLLTRGPYEFDKLLGQRVVKNGAKSTEKAPPK